MGRFILRYVKISTVVTGAYFLRSLSVITYISENFLHLFYLICSAAD